MKSSMRLCLAAITLMAAPACTTFKPADPGESAAAPVTKAPRLVGRIASIPEGQRFVLIQTYGREPISPDSILTTRGPEKRSANLLATGETLGQFTAADIQSGAVEIGDAVYSQHTPQDSPPPSNTQGGAISESPSP